MNDKIAQTVLAMAANRGPDKTICPSEIARELFPADWRRHMDEVRSTAIRLHQAGRVVINQKGKTIDVNNIKGPIRIRINNPSQ